MVAMATADQEISKPTNGELFVGFLLLGLMGFGGVLPLARRMIVEEKRWLRGEEFVELLGLCQFLPGGNIINLSVVIGVRFGGLAGALASITGLITAPTLVVIGLGMIYDQFQDNPYVRHVFLGLAAAAAGLLVALAFKILLPLRHKPIGIVICALCIVAITILKFPLLPTMLVLAPLSMFATWRFSK